MTVTNKIKILNRKTKQNEAQYDLDRKAAKISALFSNNLDKYDYLTGEDLGLKPTTVEQAKFEYCPLGKIFNKGLNEGGKKEGILKRLENIKDTNLTQVQAIKDQGEQQLKELKNLDKSRTLKAISEIGKKNYEANKILLDVKKIDVKLNDAELVCMKTDGTKYNFNTFTLPLKFVEKICNYEITLDEAKDDQDKLEKLINRLENYKAKKLLKIEEKKNVLKSATELFRARENIIRFFEERIFLFKGNVFKTKEELQKKLKEEEEEFINNSISFIERKSKDINNDLFKKYFDFSMPVDLTKKLFEIKDARENSKFVKEMKKRWSNLKDKIEEMSKEEIKNKKPNKILEIIDEIIDFNKNLQNQQGKGLKILTPNQMLSRLPISLAQLKTGNNSEKLKNEIR